MSDSAQTYWKSNIKIVSVLLSIWFFISFGCGILFVDFLDQFRFGGFKLGFWIAQQGSIFVFVALIYAYIYLMDKLDNEYNLQSTQQGNSTHKTERENNKYECSSLDIFFHIFNFWSLHWNRNLV